MPFGSRRSKGSVVRGDVILVDEDTDLLDPIFHSGGNVNPHWKPSRNGFKGSQSGKPEFSSKLLEENITTEKKTDSPGRTSSQFPGKPFDDVIDLDIKSATKSPSLRFPVLPNIPSDPRTSTNSNKLMKVTDERSRFVSPTPHIITSSPSGKAVVEHGRPVTTDDRVKQNNKLPNKEHPGIVTIAYRDGDMVLGSDGRKYWLQRGPMGNIGPPGQDVSGLNIFFLVYYPLF